MPKYKEDNVGDTPSSYRFGDFNLDLARGCLFKSGVEIKLRPKLYEALSFLVKNSGRLIAKQELIEAIWPDSFVTDDSLVQCVIELRRALADNDQQLLKTVPRRGYIFAAEVRPSEENAEEREHRLHSGDRAHSADESPKRKRVDLPNPRTSLIGRDREVAEAAELLLQPGVRLLTLTGAGGAGKTRLAIAVAHAIVGDFSGGVQFVGLASITNPDLVASALAKSLTLQQLANRSLPQLLHEYLQDSRPFLFVLDNFEQVLAAATLLAEILAACPTVKVLVTSRACLRLYGEQEFPVAPLERDSAVQLFVQRATAVRPNFTMTAENSNVIEQICSRLDGLPLAIELAAARTKLLSPSAILERLSSRLQLLTGGALDLPERQQTLRNTIDWSHELLNEPEQKLFRRFCVFTGGCTMEGAEAVCNTGRDLGIDLFDGLSSLVDKNLIQRMDVLDIEPRFTMLETIREYARERLLQTGEEPSTRRAQAAYCLVLAEEGNPELSPAERRLWLSRCELEIDNFRSALDWLVANQEIDWGLRLCTALFRFWDMREHLAEGRAHLETMLQIAGTGYAKQRAKVCTFLGALSTSLGDYAAAQRFLTQSLALYEELQDRWGIAASLNALGVSAYDSVQYEAAQSNLERSLQHWRELGNRLEIARCLHNLASLAKVRGNYSQALEALREATELFEEVRDHSGAAWSINQQGDIAREQGDLDGAADSYHRALNAFRETGDRWGCARSLADLGQVYCERNQPESAREAYREALETFADLDHKRGVARVLDGVACLAAQRGHAARALKLAAAAQHLREILGARPHPADQSKLDKHLASAWKKLDGAQAKTAWNEGLAMSMDQAIQYSLQERW